MAERLSILSIRRWCGLILLMLTAIAAAQEPTPDAEGNELLIDGMVTTHLGSGVSGAEVCIESPEAAEADPPLARAITGRRGEIAIKLGRPACDELRYRVKMQGFAEAVGTLDISDPDEPPFIDVTLKGAASLTGKVTQAGSGKPIADAKVQLDSAGRRLVTNTDPNGDYRFDSVYVGRALVTVVAPGFGTRRNELALGDENPPFNLQMEPERPVELTLVTNTGQPAKGVLVEAITEPSQAHVSGSSDAEGKARLAGIDLGSTGLHLRFNGEDYLAMRGYEEYLKLPASSEKASRATTQPAAANGKFMVVLAGRIRGQVTDKQTGKPIHNVRVLAGREARYDMPMDWSGPAGGFELVGVRPGIVTVTFQHSGYATLFESVDLQTGKVATLDVSLEPGVAIGGVVLDENKLPVDQVRVVADRWKEYQTLGLRAITDSTGRFDLPHVPPGEIEFSFVRPGYGKPITAVLAAGKSDHVITLQSVAVPLTSGAAPVDEAKLKPGQAIPDLAMTAIDGTQYKLSELRGKYVFLDCWASWCRPCMAEIPHVKALHAATKDRADFVLVGISLDTDAKALKKACEDNGITWPQVFGPKSGASEAFEELDGVGIPYTCLIGPDGKLIAQHLRGLGLVAEVKKLLEAGDSPAQNQPAAAP